ncbi:MAG: glycosyltransferase family 2 protein [Planctomycetaceae bacterium]
MNLKDITPLILTYNESANLQRTLDALLWASRIVVLDSGSTDDSRRIAGAYPQVEVLVRSFDDHTSQWNFGLDAVRTEWVLALDADYICPQELEGELAQLVTGEEIYYSKFRYCVFGKPLRASLYPPRAVLFRPASHRYVQDGHTQTLSINGAKCGALKSIILHDDRKPLKHWVASQGRYAELEADKLLFQGRVIKPEHRRWKDWIRCMVLLAPILTFAYCLFVQRLLLDGRAGLYYTFQRVFAELCLSLELLDRRVRNQVVRMTAKSDKLSTPPLAVPELSAARQEQPRKAA